MDRAPASPTFTWRHPRSIAPLLLGLSLGLCGPVRALGVDSPLTQSALGQALNLAFPVLLKAGERLTPECVQAEVFAGEVRVPQHLLQIVLEGESEGMVRAVRLYSPVAINEPLVHVNLSLGCPTQLQRQYTAFIDPPGLDQGARGSGSVTTGIRAPQYTPAMRAAMAAAGARPETLLASNARAPVAPSAAAAAVPPESARAAAAPREPALSPHAKSLAPAALPAIGGPRLAAAKSPKQPKPEPALRSVGLKSGETPRLRLDPPDAEEAAESPLAQIAAAEVALLRLRQLEELLNRLQQDNQGSRAKVQALRSQLEATPVDEGPQPALWGLAGLSLGLAGLSAFLWNSRRKERAERDAAWWTGGRADALPPEVGGDAAPRESVAGSSAPSAPLRGGAVEQDSVANASAPAPLLYGAAAGAPPSGWASATGAMPAVPGYKPVDERTITLPPPEPADDVGGDPGDDFLSAPMPLADDGASEPLSIQLLDTPNNFVNDTGAFTAPVPLNVTAVGNDHVTVEELIDLEQQVEFFLVLGQSDAAVELLQARIDFGGASALPYLKLMEIHQRQGDEVLFQHAAAAFAKRFDALAPTWGADLNSGRDLEAYAADLQRIQSRWADAAASMALVQELLSRGGAQGQGFDLPAYRELLFLYSVARDRSEHEVRGEEIDLFLPLDGDGSSSGGTPGDGHELMATMIWQGKAMPGPQHALEVDITLDDPNAAASRITAPGRF